MVPLVPIAITAAKVVASFAARNPVLTVKAVKAATNFVGDKVGKSEDSGINAREPKDVASKEMPQEISADIMDGLISGGVSKDNGGEKIAMPNIRANTHEVINAGRS